MFITFNDGNTLVIDFGFLGSHIQSFVDRGYSTALVLIEAVPAFKTLNIEV